MCSGYGPTIYYSEGDRYQFNSSYRHLMHELSWYLLILALSQAGAHTRAPWKGGQPGEEGMHSTQRLMGRSRRIIHADDYTPKFFNKVSHQKPTWDLPIMIKETPGPSFQHRTPIVGSHFYLQSSEQSPTRWSTDTNPGHPSGSGSNLPLHGIVLGLTRSTASQPVCKQPVPHHLCWAQHFCWLRLLSAVLSATWKALESQASWPVTFVTSASTLHVREGHRRYYGTIVISHFWDTKNVLCNCKNNAPFPRLKAERNWLTQFLS